MPPSGWILPDEGIDEGGVPRSEKPPRKNTETFGHELDEQNEADVLEAEALWDFTSWDEEELSFCAGDVIMVRFEF